MGLLLPHKSTVRVWPDMVTVSINRDTEKTGGGKRGQITCFSRESRYRLFRLLHTLRFTKFSFVTLTYGSSFPNSAVIAKAHLKAFRRATERRFGRIPGIWRMEIQSRGAIHFHILYLDPPFIPVQDWCAIWDNARKAPMDERYGNSLDLKANAVTEVGGTVGKYLGKYIAKEDARSVGTLPDNPGRIWGRWNISETPPVVFEISAYEKARLDRLLLAPDNQAGWHPQDKDAYTVFGGTMGREDLKEKVLWECGMLLNYTRKVKGVSVRFDACNLVEKSLH